MPFSSFTDARFSSSKAEDDHDEAERERERREMELVPEYEKKEMRDIYQSKGLSENEAREVVELLWPYKEAFLGALPHLSISLSLHLSTLCLHCCQSRSGIPQTRF